MKKSIRKLIIVFAVCAVSALAAMASGCSLTDKIKDKIEQARCEHEWNEGEVTKEATCTEVGELTKTCALCGKVETEEIELVDHIAVYVKAVSPTCTKTGLTDGTVCKVCEKQLSGFQKTPALGHIVVKDFAVAATCLQTGLTLGEHCSRCSEVLLKQNVVPALGHKIVEIAEVPATCTTSGVSSGSKCELCDTVFSGLEELLPIQHIDENEDNSCDFCKKTMSQNVNMLEVAVEEGELVAGNWYRLYRPVGESNSTFSGFDVTYGSSSLNFMASSSSSTNNPLNYIFLSGPLYQLNGFEVVYGDGYIDFHFVQGSYEFVKDGEIDSTKSVFVVDNTTAITDIRLGEGYGLYRLVERD